MAFADLIPWGRNRPMTTATARFGEENDAFAALSRDMNRLLDDFTRGFGVSVPTGFGVSVPTGFGASGTWPHVEVIETEKEVKVVAELPGMEQNDIDLSLHDGMLTLKGEKKSESNGAHYSERWHGKFQRSLQVGPDLDPERVQASFRNGVLTVTLAKCPEAQRQVKRIPISNS
jgi:HSP20 family protein